MNKLDYIKANRRGSRDAELENKSGWSACGNVHKTNKQYNRKHKENKKWKKELN